MGKEVRGQTPPQMGKEVRGTHMGIEMRGQTPPPIYIYIYIHIYKCTFVVCYLESFLDLVVRRLVLRGI